MQGMCHYKGQEVRAWEIIEGHSSPLMMLLQNLAGSLSTSCVAH